MPYRLLALVTVLIVGDYLLWNWSMAGSHDTVALLSGLTLPLLMIIFVRLLIWSLGHLIASSARVSRMHINQKRTPNPAGPSAQTGISPEDSIEARSHSDKLAA
ncbi:MAG: hypothetical protein ACRDK2_02180 [Solirubrobacteraceae bacterium]